MLYNWQQSDWPEFKYELSAIQDALFAVAEKTGVVSGMVKGLPETDQINAAIQMIVTEAIKNSEIEGEFLSRKDVVSSVRNNLGLNDQFESVRDVRAKGISELMVSMRNNFSKPLTEEVLFAWHKMLMAGSAGAEVGAWRTHPEPVQVVSGRLDKPQVHFEAPPSKDVPEKMRRFIKWFNETVPGGPKEIKPAVVRAAVVHLYFETIHPFIDGNGRMGRVLSEKAFYQGVGSPVLISLSKTIEADKKSYYNALKKAQRSNEVTEWISYFVKTVIQAQGESEEMIHFTLAKGRFFEKFREQLNDRQTKVVKRAFAEGPGGFANGISAKKYASISSASKATATRDLQHLLSMGALIRIGQGRSTKYKISICE